MNVAQPFRAASRPLAGLKAWLIEDWELPAFRDQFGSTSQYGRVDWPPAFVYRDEVRIYDFADRARHLEGQPIATRTVPLD